MVERKLEEIKKHIVDTTAGLTISLPIIASLETLVLGINTETSYHARFTSSCLAYLGLGSLFSRGRDQFRRLLKINDKTRERTKQICDLAYGATFNLLMSPPLYYVAGVRDPKQMALSIGMSVCIGTALGAPAGYMIDTYRDFTGIKKSNRVPNYFINLNSKTKIFLAGTLTCLSLCGTLLLYKLQDYEQNKYHEVIKK